MNASAVPLTTVAWKWPGTRSVLCTMMLICSVPMVTPVMPPTKPKITTEKHEPDEAGIAPRRLAQPLEHALGEAAQPHAESPCRPAP